MLDNDQWPYMQEKDQIPGVMLGALLQIYGLKRRINGEICQKDVQEMIKHFCDRCGKEDKPFELHKVTFSRQDSTVHDITAYKTWELCEPCITDLEKWTKRKRSA